MNFFSTYNYLIITHLYKKNTKIQYIKEKLDIRGKKFKEKI